MSSTLESWVGQPLWRLAMNTDPTLTEELAKKDYGFSMISKIDITEAFPPTLAGVLSAAELRLRKISENAFQNLIADYP